MIAVTPVACQQLAQQLTKLTAKIVHMYSSLSVAPSTRERGQSDEMTENADMLQGKYLTKIF